MKTLNIIGCGKVGTSLAALWQQNNCFTIGDVLNRSEESASNAVQTIGAGHAIANLDQMQAADVYLIGTPDDALLETCDLLSASELLRKGDVVFQCSGSLASDAFTSAIAAGAHVASVHPIKGFTAIDTNVNAFAGTFCGVEGNEAALSVLSPAFEVLGAQLLAIDPNFKMVYHAAAVMASNNLTALMELSMQAYQKSGIKRDQAAQLMQPIVEKTIENIFSVGPVKALTGPIARGDHLLVEKQLAEVEAWNPQFAETYRSLGKVALSLSIKQGAAPATSLQKLQGTLEQK